MEHLSLDEQRARGRLQDMVRQNGTSLAALSRLIGRNPAYLQQFVSRGSPRHLDEPDLRKITQFLGISTKVIDTRPVNERPTGVSDERDRGEWVDVPRFAVGASAGSGALPGQENSYDSFRFSRRWLAEQGLERAQLSALRVEGDSMEPLLNNGDEILVDCSPCPFRDGIHVVRLGETLMVKRIASAGPGRIALLSQNLAYPPVEVAADDVRIIGRVVWKGGRV